MVFLRLGLGFVTGLTIPLLVHDNIYLTIASSFLRPHLRFRIEQSKLTKAHATQTETLDTYLKDVVGSFLLFFVAIGPVVYYTYFSNKLDKKMQGEEEEQEQKVIEDKYAKMLVAISERA